VYQDFWPCLQAPCGGTRFPALLGASSSSFSSTATEQGQHSQLLEYSGTLVTQLLLLASAGETTLRRHSQRSPDNLPGVG
jgi:hypothetical protein